MDARPLRSVRIGSESSGSSQAEASDLMAGFWVREATDDRMLIN